MEQNILYVRMFGKFSLSYGDKQISCDNSRSKQMWSILAYLIYNRGKVISSEELMMQLWNADKSDNPPGAMLLPASGSYRMRIQWIWNETVVEEEILYFFVNTN